MDDLHHFHLVELVLADHAARIAAVAARFGAEAWRMRRHLDRQRIGGDDFIAHDIGQRDFGGRDQVQRRMFGAGLGVLAALLHREQVFLELRQLPGAAQRIGVDDIRRVALGIAVLAGVRIQHELRQRPMQARDTALHHGEARTGQLGRNVEFQPQRGADIDMVLGLEIEAARRADLAHFNVRRLIVADRHRFVRQVRQRQHEIAERGLHLVQLLRRCLQLIADAAHFGHHRRGILALALQHADLFGQAVAPPLQFFGAGLDLLALRFQRIEGGDVQFELARRQAGGDAVDIFAQELDVDHGNAMR